MGWWVVLRALERRTDKHTLYLGLTCRCVCPILTYGKSSKVHKMMAILFRYSPLPIRVQTGRQKDFNRQSARLREYPRKLFCVLELSSTFRKENNRKEKWKETWLVFLRKAFAENMHSWIAFKFWHRRCYSSHISSTWSFRKITYTKTTNCLFLITYIFNKPLTMQLLS